MKKLIISLCILFAIPVLASETLIPQSYSEQFVVAYNAPRTLNLPRGAFLPTEDGYCVSFLKEHGFEAYRGNAYEWIKYVDPNAFGWPGDAILLDEGPFQHLAKIIGNNGGYNLVEQNYEGRWIVSYRTIPFDYEKIVGIIPQ